MNRIFVFLVACSVLFGGCRADVPDYFAFRKTRFRAELRGQLDGVDFCAVIEAAPLSTDTKNASRIEKNATTVSKNAFRSAKIAEARGSVPQPVHYTVRLEYLGAPESALGGLCITWNTAERYAAVTAGAREHTVGCGEAAVEGLLRPAAALLAGEDFAQVQRIGTGYVLTYSDGVGGARLTLDARGLPRAFSSDRVQFEVMWWE